MVFHRLQLAFLSRRIVFEHTAVGQARAAFIAEKIDKHFVFPDVLRPSSVEGNRRFIRTDISRNEIFHIVCSVQILRILRPHTQITIFGHVLCHLAVCVAGDGFQLRPAEDI